MELISREQAIDALYSVDEYNSRSVTAIKQLSPIQPEIVRCKDCKHFEYDHVESVNGIPLIVAHEICMRWGDGVKTSENGYCFLAERREVNHDQREGNNVFGRYED